MRVGAGVWVRGCACARVRGCPGVDGVRVCGVVVRGRVEGAGRGTVVGAGAGGGGGGGGGGGRGRGGGAYCYLVLLDINRYQRSHAVQCIGIFMETKFVACLL